MIPKGAPAKFTPHKGSWGDGFVIEMEKKEPEQLKNVSCKHCKYFDDTDNTCNKNGERISNMSRDKWKRCQFFILCPSYAKEERFKERVLKEKKDYCIEDPQFFYYGDFRSELIGTGRGWYDVDPQFIELAKRVRARSCDYYARNLFLSYVPSDMKEALHEELSSSYSQIFVDRVEYMLRLIGIDTSIYWNEKKSKHYVVKKIRDGILDRVFDRNYDLSNDIVCRMLFMESFIDLMKRKKCI